MDERLPRSGSYPDIVPAERASVYLASLRRRWWLVLAVVILAAVAGFVVASRQQKRYDASAKVLLTTAEPVNLLLHSTAGASSDPERDLNTQVELVKLDSIAQHVRAELGLPLTSAQLLREIRAAADGNSNLLTITARDAVPARAAAIANAFARQYADFRRRQAQEAYSAAAGQALLELRSLSPAQRDGVPGTALRQQMRELQVAGALQTGGVHLVDAASVSTTPATPRPKLAAAAGGLIGFLVGALAAIALGSLRARQRAAKPIDDGLELMNGPFAQRTNERSPLTELEEEAAVIRTAPPSAAEQ
jgi:uncharacterized protein involved in exopolysaccharide biosynthesis